MPAKMKSTAPGKSISGAEIQDITKNGVWLLLNGEEFFLPFDEYPWFKKAAVSAVYDVRLLHKIHLHWPQLDVDLDAEALRNPRAYPLVYRP